MGTNAENAYEVWTRAQGETEGTGDWYDITQDRVDQFADVTEDHQFIHVDPERAKDTPFGGTIAHGFLTLSLLTHLGASIPQGDPERYQGIAMGLNYGFDKVRFVSPVPVGSRVRATSVLKAVELKDPSTIQTTRTFTVEVEGQERPALVADWITRLIFA